MPDAKVPGLGKIPKPALYVGGIVLVGVGVYVWLRHKANSSGTGAYGYSAYGYGLQQVPLGEYGYGSYYGYNLGAYAYNAYGEEVYPGVGSAVGSVGTVVGTPIAATNAEWAQAAEAYLSDSGGYDPTTVAAALGKYITGQSMTADQAAIAEAAIAVEGYPPQSGANGDPPAINTAPPAGQTGGGAGVGSGGGGSGSGGGSKSKTKVYTSDGRQTLGQIAKAFRTTGGHLIALKGNTYLARYYATNKKIPKGYKINVPA